MQTFTERFEAANGGPIQHEGRELQKSFSLPVKKGDSFELRFLRAAERPVQGLGLKCEGCKLMIADTVAASIALWTDTAPESVSIQVVKAKPGARVIIFNQWRDEKYGSTMYHLNNAAMEIVPQPDGWITLRCSDGWGDPDFNDLIAALRLKPRQAQ